MMKEAEGEDPILMICLTASLLTTRTEMQMGDVWNFSTSLLSME